MSGDATVFIANARGEERVLEGVLDEQAVRDALNPARYEHLFGGYSRATRRVLVWMLGHVARELGLTA